jgi:hypothetical protein
LRRAAPTRFGRIDGRIRSRSALIGLASAISGCPPPNSTASLDRRKEKVTASVIPRAASARRARTARSCSGASARFGRVVSRVSGVTGMNS